MDFLNTILGFAGTGLGKVFIGVSGGLLLWPALNWAFDFIKPLEPFSDYAVEKARNWGRNTNSFLKKRIKDDALRAKITDELAGDSNKIQEAFVDGLRNG